IAPRSADLAEAGSRSAGAEGGGQGAVRASRVRDRALLARGLDDSGRAPDHAFSLSGRSGLESPSVFGGRA
ncbi:MAG: hypothetical protein ACOCVR_02550, partial [Myxococcota bacterium]